MLREGLYWETPNESALWSALTNRGVVWSALPGRGSFCGEQQEEHPREHSRPY